MFKLLLFIVDTVLQIYNQISLRVQRQSRACLGIFCPVCLFVLCGWKICKKCLDCKCTYKFLPNESARHITIFSDKLSVAEWCGLLHIKSEKMAITWSTVYATLYLSPICYSLKAWTAYTNTSNVLIYNIFSPKLCVAWLHWQALVHSIYHTYSIYLSAFHKTVSL